MTLFLAALLVVAAALGLWYALRRPAPPDVREARQREADAVRKADERRDSQKAQPLLSWVNQRFGRRP